MLGYSTLEASKALAVALCLFSRIALKNRTVKEKPSDPFRSRHTRMPSSRHVGGYLMLCREDCCGEEG
jgi:hypothetical protein